MMKCLKITSNRSLVAGTLLTLCSSIITTPGYATSEVIIGQGTWETTLLPRDIDGDVTTIEGYYDTALDITWMPSINSTSRGGLLEAKAWAENLDVAGVTGWRLPAMTSGDVVLCDNSYGGTNCGYNVDPYSSELAHMFHITLGNNSLRDTNGNSTGPIPEDGPVINVGPFYVGPHSNLVTWFYWADSLKYGGCSSSIDVYAVCGWYFDFYGGYQDSHDTRLEFPYWWAVHDGDIANLPPPEPDPEPLTVTAKVTMDFTAIVTEVHVPLFSSFNLIGQTGTGRIKYDDKPDFTFIENLGRSSDFGFDIPDAEFVFNLAGVDYIAGTIPVTSTYGGNADLRIQYETNSIPVNSVSYTGSHITQLLEGYNTKMKIDFIDSTNSNWSTSPGSGLQLGIDDLQDFDQPVRFTMLIEDGPGNFVPGITLALDSSTSTIIDATDLELTLNSSVAQVAIGDTITYDALITNLSTTVANDSGVIFTIYNTDNANIQITSNRGLCSTANKNSSYLVYCHFNNILPGEVVDVSMAIIAQEGDFNDELTVIARVSSSNFDSNPGNGSVGNNVASVRTPLLFDADSDGFNHTVDCNDQHPFIYPGAPEIKHDGIDQDCNGYDLTIDIITAVYNTKRKFLEVAATSTLGSAAALNVTGYGSMKVNRKTGNWELGVRKLSTAPTTVTVSGVEGSVSAAVQIK